MLIEYIGHSCFYLTSQDGVRVIIDPYDPSIGLSAFKREADAALLTHNHYDHAYLDAVTGNYTLIDGPGQRVVKDACVTGLNAPHDDRGGSIRGIVTTYVIDIDGVRVLHLGDIGALPSDEYLESIGKIDVLMVPVGGTYTVDAQAAAKIADMIDANITIPMHYKTHRLNIDIKPPHAFLELVKADRDISRLGTNKFEIDPRAPKKRGRVLLMENGYGD